MEYNDSGRLGIRAYTAGAALPVKDALIRIRGSDENNRFVEYSLITDEDGVTEVINLPSPTASYSLAPNSPEVPYAVYDIEAGADGYYTKTIHNVAVFPGVTTVLPVNMIPVSIGQNGSVYPRGSLDTTVRENIALENHSRNGV